MVTDPPPDTAALRREFDASDRLGQMPLPQPSDLVGPCQDLGAALAAEDRTRVRTAGIALLTNLAAFYRVSRPQLAVLGARPLHVVDGRWSFELFGDYTIEKKRIRVWMRTAVRGRVTSHRGLLNTLLHEFCHHLDVCRLGFSDSPHTRGFFSRVDGRYHLALQTPPEQQRPLRWIRKGRLWRVDWTKLRPPTARKST